VAALKRLAAETTTAVRNWDAQTDLTDELAAMIDPSADIYHRPLPRKRS
jgi:hypothetical protein